MKFKLSGLVVNLIVLAAIIFLFLLSRFTDLQQQLDRRTAFSKAEPILLGDVRISDTIPYYKYKHLTDSVKYVHLLSDGNAGYMTRLHLNDVIATSSATACDNCSMPHDRFSGFKQHSHEVYYLDLPGWTLKHPIEYHTSYDLSAFYLKNDTGFIRKNKKDMAVKFRYNYLNQHLLIPVTGKKWNTVNTIFLIIIVLSSISFLFLVVMFVLLLYNIRKGKIFTNNNLLALLLIALTLLILPLIKVIGNYLLKFIFADYFTDDVIMNTGIFADLWKMVAAGLVTMLIYKAFLSGKELTEEQELTI